MNRRGGAGMQGAQLAFRALMTARTRALGLGFECWQRHYQLTSVALQSLDVLFVCALLPLLYGNHGQQGWSKWAAVDGRSFCLA